MITTLLSSKNRSDKLESLSKVNINKCIQWCEKYRIPYNKFTDKVNIFLANSLNSIQNKYYHQIELEYFDNDKNDDDNCDTDVNDDEIDNSDEMNIETSSIIHDDLDDEMHNTFKIINDIIMNNLDDSENIKNLESVNMEVLHKNVSEMVDNIINEVVTRVEGIKDNDEYLTVNNDIVSTANSSRIKSSVINEGSLYIHAVLKNLPRDFNKRDQVPKKSFSIKVASDKC